MALFSKVLIANRGEIAVRIARACRALGIRPVAVYSDADRTALHTRFCDEAYNIGPAPAAESYLRADRILEVAKEAHCEAVHPGFGFLAENADFAQAVIDAGLVWVGPPPAAIALMGLKTEAKRLAQAHGVPIVPGYFGDDQTLTILQEQARLIGFPVLIKASAGGGGKGMRVVDTEAGFEAALDGARREALASFGDERVMLEKYLPHPRHIEIQVLGDKHGNVVHLGERECSIQRRHQKVVEESPSPAMTPELRAEMASSALALARAAGYENAGTMEFIFQDGQFYFLEMNTRLQVEHPVTEEALGVDIVQMQLRVAAGEPLPLAQDQVRFTAHALEVRLYAEDPDRGFLPSIGDLSKLRLPFGIEMARVDAGVEQGDAVSPFYDPMIAKIITWGATRPDAIEKMQEALGYTEVQGVQTNLTFLRWLVAHPRFLAGDISTRFIEEEYRPGAHAEIAPEIVVAAALAAGRRVTGDRTLYRPSPEAEVWHEGPWRQLRQEMPVSLNVEGRTYDVRLTQEPGLGYRLHCTIHDGDLCTYDGIFSVQSPRSVTPGQPGVFSLGIGTNGGLRRVTVSPTLENGLFSISTGGQRYWAQQAPALSTDTLATAVRLADEESLESPMPGKVLKVMTAPGDDVVDGQPLVIIEAMKMEFTVKAPHDGKVESVYYRAGDQVAVGDVLIKLAAHDST